MYSRHMLYSRFTWRWLLLALLLTCGKAQRASAQQEAVREIKPPFGLGWGETAERIERLLKGAKATIVARRQTRDGREAWDVEGLVQTGLRRTVFYFKRMELCEVELQYEKTDWDQAKYDDFMGQVRRRIEQRYGAGQQIVRKTEPEGTVTQTIVGYSWNLNNTEINLYFYSAKDEAHIFRTLSVHYKTM
jgi:hypothetical protein